MKSTRNSLFMLTLLAALCQSCLKTRISEPVRDVISSGPNELSVEARLAENGPELPRIQGKYLRVQRLYIKTVQSGAVQLKMVSFSRDGDSEFAEYDICSVATGACKKGSEVTSQLMVPLFETGQIIVRVRACVRPERAKVEEENCGPWEEREYKQHSPFSEALKKNIALKTDLYKKIVAKGPEVTEALVWILQNRTDCVRQGMWSKGWENILKTYVLLGSHLVALSITNEPTGPGEKIVNGAAEKWGGYSGTGVSQTISDEQGKKISDGIEKTNKELITMNHEDSKKYKAILSEGISGLQDLHHRIMDYFIKEQEFQKCSVWNSTSEKLTVLNQQLSVLRFELHRANQNINKALNP